MTKIINRIKKLSFLKKVQLAAVIIVTLALLIIIPAYAWFTNEKKAAEMYKIQYPNTLYINAAHREDQIYFDLDSVNVNELERDANGNVIYYTDETYTTKKYIEVDGQRVYDKSGVTHVITSQKYVFSVFGKNTDKFKLQLAYTNNNQFKYNIYEATEYTTKPQGSSVKYVTSKDAHIESVEIFPGDSAIAEDIPLYYVMDNEALQGAYLNTQQGDLNAKNNDNYYKNNYGSNTNVQELSVPIYWQSTDIDIKNATSNKQFCNYFVLEVTWDQTTRAAEKKETDMIAITVQRVG